MKIKVFTLLLIVAVLPVWAQKADRSQVPATEPVRNLVLPSMETFLLKNGMKVYYMPKKGVPLVSVSLSFNAGSAMDPADKTGLAGFTAALMKDGAGTRDALALSDEIDFLGISLGTGAAAEEAEVSLFTPVSKLDAALDLFRDVALKPRFEAKEWERRQREALVSLAQAHDEARIIASTAFMQLLYGPNHPYARRATEASIKAIKIQDIQAFYRQYYTAANGYFVVVGDVTKEQIKAKLDARFGLWKGGTRQTVKIPDAAPTKGRTIVLIDKPGAAQTELRFGSVAVKRNTPDYLPLVVMNTILGGSFTSRLNQNIRETHGYAYGANSGFNMPRAAIGHFQAGAGVQTNVTDKAVTEFMKELTNIKSVTADEMNRARNYEALSYPENFASVSAIAGNVGDKIYHNLPDDYFNTYIAKVLGVSQTDVERVAKTYINPDQLVIVMVGDLSKIKEGVEALNLGPIKVMTKEDVLGAIPVMQ